MQGTSLRLGLLFSETYLENGVWVHKIQIFKKFLALQCFPDDQIKPQKRIIIISR